MEANKEQQILDILPPRIEDAGLEDCALPPESIKEAFLKAATAVKSRASSLFTTEEEERHDCVNNPWPVAKDGESDALVVVVGDLPVEPGPCAVDKNGGVVEEGKDKVVVAGGEIADVDDCIGGDDEARNRDKKPILTEGFV